MKGWPACGRHMLLAGTKRSAPADNPLDNPAGRLATLYHQIESCRGPGPGPPEQPAPPLAAREACGARGEGAR